MKTKNISSESREIFPPVTWRSICGVSFSCIGFIALCFGSAVAAVLLLAVGSLLLGE